MALSGAALWRACCAGGVVVGALAGSSCAGQGQGSVSGTADIPECNMTGAYDLHASFFGANFYNDSLEIRIQNGGGTQEFSDNLVVTIDQVSVVQQMIAASGTGSVTLPVGLRGVPGILVHATFAPNWSCGRTKDTRLGQDVGLWADSDPGTGATSTITFRSVASPYASSTSSADPNLTDAPSFSFWMHDPRALGETPSNNPRPDGSSATDNSPVGQATLSGNFRFEYSRGRPAQEWPVGP